MYKDFFFKFEIQKFRYVIQQNRDNKVLETILVTSAAFAFSPWSIITIYSILNGNKKIEGDEQQNYNQVSIYREHFEIGYTSYIKKFLNYLLHLSHEELLISLTVLITLLSVIFKSESNI